jgi:hypothetical protein
VEARRALWWLMALLLTSWLTPRNGQGAEFSHQFESVGFTRNNSPLPGTWVGALAATSDGLWVGTGGGLARFHQGQWQVYTPQNSPLPHVWVGALAATSDGLWVGMQGRGLAGGLARFHQGPLPEILDLVGRPEKDRVTQSRHTFAVILFDPTYQMAGKMFRYHWVLTRHTILHTVTHDESTTYIPVKTFTFKEQEDGHYILTVTAIDTHGVRSRPFPYPFEVALPRPPPPLLVWLKRGLLSGTVLSLLYLLVLFPLIPLYTRRSWARTALNSGVFSKFGYRFKPGHPVFSITCRDGLTALSWHGQLPDLCQHALKQIRKRPPEKPRRRCCPVCGSTIKVMQHRPHLVATHRQAAMVMLHLREIAVSTFNRR